ncbi:MAG TPA: phosphate acetyltransferase [bacterium]|nr:phosphate acetyltransferase [bacterium]
MTSLWDKARRRAARIALPEPQDRRITEAAALTARNRIALPILVGPAGSARTARAGLGHDAEGITWVDPAESRDLARYAQILFERRKHKGLTEAGALQLAHDPLYFAALMLAAGDADGLVAGASTATAEVLRALLWCVGKAETAEVVSSCFMMIVGGAGGRERVLFFADAGVVPDPSAAELAGIAIATAKTRSILVGDEPYVAMLSFSTRGSAEHPCVAKVREATEIAKRLAPELAIDGELQVDAALVPDVAQAKAKSSPVAGHANVLIFPSLDAANIGYKLVERLAGGKAVGPLLQGLRKPACDLSRGCRVEDVVDAIAVTAVQKEVSPESGSPQ